MGTRESRDAVLFRIATVTGALPIEHVIETMRPLPIEPIAGAPDGVLGVAVIRGAAVPVINAARLFGHDGARPTRFVTVRLPSARTAALAVEAVLGVRRLALDVFAELPPLLRGGTGTGGAIDRLGTIDDELVVVLRAGRLVPDSVWEALAPGASA